VVDDSAERRRDAESDNTVREDGRFFSTENTAQFGRFTIPFPFSAIIGILAIPLLFIAAGLSVPYMAVRNILESQREGAFRRTMSLAGRTISWPDALLEVSDSHGTLLEEYISIKGPYRLWVTSENLAEASPFPCCFEEFPWFDEAYKHFFQWCRSRYTAPDTGIAKLIDIHDVPEETIRASLGFLRTNHRCVSVGHLPE
jgi:hypothetical protein